VNTIAIVFLGGNHERAEFVPKALDFGFAAFCPSGYSVIFGILECDPGIGPRRRRMKANGSKHLLTVGPSPNRMAEMGTWPLIAHGGSATTVLMLPETNDPSPRLSRRCRRAAAMTGFGSVHVDTQSA
jgi:hypothetical protein